MLYNKHMLSISAIDMEDIKSVIRLTNIFKNNISYGYNLLKDRIIAFCFFEPSTRTRLSFETSALKLGAKIVTVNDMSSTSISKGESVRDTIKIISCYVDAVIIRTNLSNIEQIVDKNINVPVINAGDGINQHPTQSLSDLFTIKETQKRLNNLEISIIGDLKNNRSVHSLVIALSKFHNNIFHFISPAELKIPSYIINILDLNKILWTYSDCLEKKIIKNSDILYITRFQKERMHHSAECIKYPILDFKKINFSQFKKNMKILHPLPRLGELPTWVDDTKHAYYFQQAKNGLYTRAAILSLILNKNHIKNY